MEEIKCPECGSKLVKTIYDSKPSQEQLDKANNKELFIIESDVESLEDDEVKMTYYCYKCNTCFSNNLKSKEKVYYSDVVIQ